MHIAADCASAVLSVSVVSVSLSVCLSVSCLSSSSNSHAMDALVDVDGVLSGHHLVDG